MRVLVTALVVAAALPGVVGGGARAAGRPPAGTFTGCPSHTLPLQGAPRSFERTLDSAVLRFVRTSFSKFAQTPSSQLAGARVRFVTLVRDWLPSGWIKSECGGAVWRDSVAVDVYFPRLDKPHNPVGHCNACAHLTFLAARGTHGWSVWGRY